MQTTISGSKGASTAPANLNPPSRQFLIGQAVLEAALESFPFGVKRYGVAGVLRRVTAEAPHHSQYFIEATRFQFTKLVDRYYGQSDLERAGAGGLR